jgi:predicted TIM-barrel fold metal-dependent hydrolase
MDRARSYTPGPADADDLARHQAALGLERVIVVQPSIYGTDNRATLDAVARIGAGARGVAVVGDASDAELKALDAGGIRGLRLNLAAVGASDLATISRQVIETAERCAGQDWLLQIFTELPVIERLAPALAALPCPLILDHFGRATARYGVGQPGFASLLHLVGTGAAYVKIAAPYIVSNETDWADCEPLARAIATANPERTLWGSNWPHPTGGTGNRSVGIAPFREVDDGVALNRLGDWIGPDNFRACLVDNPARVFRF